MSYGWRFVILYRRQGETIPKKKKFIKAKWLSEDAYCLAGKRREAKAKEKRKDVLI